MITVSEKFNELMQSNARPKAVPTIRTLGLINNKEWKTTDIVDWEWVHYIDPLGAEPSFIELRWNEIVTDKRKLNSLSHDMAINNVAVELTIKQDLAWYVSWESLENKTWAELEEMTWEEIETNVPYEEITFPKLFISGKPQTNNTTIAWTAKDILSVSDFAVKKFFPETTREFVAPLQNMISEQRAYYINNTEMVSTLTDSMVELSAQQAENNLITNAPVYVDGENPYRDVFRLYAALQSRSITFAGNGKIKLVNYDRNFATAQHAMSANTMSSFPTIVQNENISIYKFTRKEFVVDTESKTTTKPQEYKNLYGRMLYKIDYGIPTQIYYEEMGGHEDSAVDNGLSVYTWSAGRNVPSAPYIITNKQEEYLLNKGVGLVYEEDNTLNAGTYNDGFNRALRVYDYYRDSYNITFDSLPVLNMQAGDIVQVDTGYQDENGENIVILGIVINIKFKYNGAIRQSVELHGVKL